MEYNLLTKIKSGQHVDAMKSNGFALYIHTQELQQIQAPSV